MPRKESERSQWRIKWWICNDIIDPPELNLEENSVMQTEEESWTLQDWIDQSHKNEI